MKAVVSRLLIALVLFAAAWLSWSEARLAARVADARQQMATLQFQVDDSLKPAASVSDYLPERRAVSRPTSGAFAPPSPTGLADMTM